MWQIILMMSFFTVLFLSLIFITNKVRPFESPVELYSVTMFSFLISITISATLFCAPIGEKREETVILERLSSQEFYKIESVESGSLFELTYMENNTLKQLRCSHIQFHDSEKNKEKYMKIIYIMPFINVSNIGVDIEKIDIYD